MLGLTADMAKFKKIKLISIICFVSVLLNVSVFAQDNYQQIYDSLQKADFEYMFGLDPYQKDEYKKSMRAPYPLFRTGVTMIFKDMKISPVYYLLTPRSKNGKNYVLFKTNGKVQYIIPVYKKEVVPPDFYKKYVPAQKLTLWQKTCKKARNAAGRIAPNKTQQKPAPKSYIDVNEIGGSFWEVVLYFGNSKYHMIFLKE